MHEIGRRKKRQHHEDAEAASEQGVSRGHRARIPRGRTNISTMKNVKAST